MILLIDWKPFGKICMTINNFSLKVSNYHFQKTIQTTQKQKKRTKDLIKATEQLHLSTVNKI